jgi:hypothetical protein
MWNQLASNTKISKPVLTKVADEMGSYHSEPQVLQETAPNFGINRSQLVRLVELAVGCITACTFSTTVPAALRSGQADCVIKRSLS